MRLTTWLAACGLVCAWSCDARAQVRLPAVAPMPVATSTATNPSLPEPIYWKQDVFLIPYQWGSPAEPAAAQAVWLFVSKDRGASWQKISEAKPQVRAFNYRADGEGEYWFAIRTLDRQGREWPAGAYQPELRVVVDTTMPRIEELRGQIVPGGPVEIAWRCSDANLDPNSLAIEAQVDSAGNWQPVPLVNSTTTPGAVTTSALGLTSVGQIQWPCPADNRPLAIRATVLDKAKNIATFRAELTLVAGTATSVPSSMVGGSNPTSVNKNSPFTAPMSLSAPPTSGWTSATNAPPQTAPPENQPWPAITDRIPFRLSSAAAPAPNDGVTAYGSPPIITTPPVTPTTTPPADHGADNSVPAAPRVEAPLATMPRAVEGGLEQAPLNGPRFAALDPFRQTSSVHRLPAPAPTPGAPTTAASSPPRFAAIGPVANPHPAPHQVKRVGSRTFALEYDLDPTGRWGVSKVELWGTRDAGKSWHSFAVDDDHRSPLVVTVDDEGLYGFRIAADIAGSAPATPPSPGEQPELWVEVDLRRPVVELTGIERGDGNLGDHLIFRWKVADDNLEPRPIALFYSSRPTGPWSAIATSLEDTGEYAWRVERFVPARFYVRLEARDTAGNLAAFQTREPIDFAPLSSPGHLRAAAPLGPPAVSAEESYR